jgi:hypothetical protein
MINDATIDLSEVFFISIFPFERGFSKNEMTERLTPEFSREQITWSLRAALLRVGLNELFGSS